MCKYLKLSIFLRYDRKLDNAIFSNGMTMKFVCTEGRTYLGCINNFTIWRVKCHHLESDWGSKHICWFFRWWFVCCCFVCYWWVIEALKRHAQGHSCISINCVFRFGRPKLTNTIWPFKFVEQVCMLMVVMISVLARFIFVS